jgi:hypothetical protein
MSSPGAMIIAADGADGLAFSYPDFQLTFKVKLDGKDYPVAGPTIPPGAAGGGRKRVRRMPGLGDATDEHEE